VLLTAHYDSVNSAPGAGDDGMAVAAMVETLRALRAGPPPRNDLIFLFNDGEEPGMYGSQGFIEQHPWAADVRVVFDFDADGPTGPSTIGWTTPRDGWLLREMARAGTGLVAGPLVNPSKRREFENDLHVYAAAGYAGAHLDVVGGSTFYHTARDSLANADLASLQHQGAAMLALARHFGSVPINAVPADDAMLLMAFGAPLFRAGGGRPQRLPDSGTHIGRVRAIGCGVGDEQRESGGQCGPNERPLRIRKRRQAPHPSPYAARLGAAPPYVPPRIRPAAGHPRQALGVPPPRWP
jgi:hypothetical protein